MELLWIKRQLIIKLNFQNLRQLFYLKWIDP